MRPWWDEGWRGILPISYGPSFILPAKTSLMTLGGRHTTLHGTVIRQTPQGDSNRLIEVLTSEQGRIRVLARGARASKKRFAGKLDYFVRLRLHLDCRRPLWSLTAAELLKPRLGLRTNLECFERATCLCEVINILCGEGERSDEVHDALEEGLDALADGRIESAATAYLKIISACGFLPAFSCERCGASTRSMSRPNSMGESFCSACTTAPTPLSPEVLAFLRGETGGALTPLAEAENVLLDLVEAQAGRALRSRQTSLGQDFD